MKSKKRAVAAGHICLDITPVFKGKKVKSVDEIFRPGRMILTEGVDVHTGGSAANTGLAMKILGSDVSIMGKIGDDEFGSLILNILSKYDAESGMIVSKDADTSYTFPLAVPGIDRMFVHDPGANHTFCSDDLNMEQIRQANLFHFGYPPLMRKIYQNGGDELVKIYQKVKACNIPTSLDLAGVDEFSEAGQADWKIIMEKVLPYVDFFVPSAEELCFMLDRERYYSWRERAKERDVTEILELEDIRPLAELALSMGAKVVLIKCGVPGMYYRTASGEQLSGLCERLSLKLVDWADKEGFEVSYQPEKILSGTGAGDTSIAAFLTSILQEESLEEAVRMAVATGACCVEGYDALSGLRPLSELKEKIQNGWKKNTFF